jgi:hypothetical protein
VAKIFVILRAVAVLASLANPSHILVYASQAILILPPSHNANDLENDSRLENGSKLEN